MHESNNYTILYDTINTFITKNKTIIMSLSVLYFTYTIVNYILFLFRYISVPIIYGCILTKIGIYSLSDSTNNNSVIIHQTFIITLIQLIISILNIIESIPLINIFSIFNYLSFGLILLSYMILLPTGIVNIIFKKLSSKIYFLNNDTLLNEPLTEKIIKFIKTHIGHKIDIINKYASNLYDCDKIDISDDNINYLTDLFDRLKIISLEHYDYEHIKKIFIFTKRELINIIKLITTKIETN